MCKFLEFSREKNITKRLIFFYLLFIQNMNIGTTNKKIIIFLTECRKTANPKFFGYVLEKMFGICI